MWYEDGQQMWVLPIIFQHKDRTGRHPRAFTLPLFQSL